jgi:hypothetical protein
MRKLLILLASSFAAAPDDTLYLAPDRRVRIG